MLLLLKALKSESVVQVSKNKNKGQALTPERPVVTFSQKVAFPET